MLSRMTKHARCHEQPERNAEGCFTLTMHLRITVYQVKNPKSVEAQSQSNLQISRVCAILIKIPQCEQGCLAGEEGCSVLHLNPNCLWQHDNVNILDLIAVKTPRLEIWPTTTVRSCLMRVSIYVIGAGVAPRACSSDHCVLYIGMKDRENRPWYE